MLWFEQRMVGIVPDVRIGIVDCLERYLVYGLGWWLHWKGAQSTDWICGKSCSNQLRIDFRE
jgi:hypothetical protein